LHPPPSHIPFTKPRILYLPEGGLVLCEKSGEILKLKHMHSGDEISLSGVLAGRLSLHLESPLSEAFPNLGPLVRQHTWLEHLQAAPPAASQLILGSGLGMLFLELTDRCNESCIHCYAESSPQRTTSLSREEIARVLHEARALGTPYLQFTGGDPLLHADLVFGVTTARELGYETLEIYTNGLALSQALLNELLPYRPAFSFSIYSSDPAVHDHITQNTGSLTRTLAAMRRVQQAGLPLRVGIILMPENKGSEDASIAFLQDEMGLDASQIGIDVVRSTGRGAFMRDYKPDMSRLQQFSHRPDSPHNHKNDSQAEDNQTSDTQAEGTQNEHKQSPTGRRGKLCIGASGNVYPCIFSRNTVLGNIRQQSLPDMLARLNSRKLKAPSSGRWQQCRESLSCSDCQAIAYLLEDHSIPITPANEEDTHATA